MEAKDKKKVYTLMKRIWYNICILERDYGVEYEGHMTQILKFTLQCIANKYEIDLGLMKEKGGD